MKESGGSKGTYSAFNSDMKTFQPIEQVDWNGRRYWNGITLKLTPWIIGHTFQLATMAAISVGSAQSSSHLLISFLIIMKLSWTVGSIVPFGGCPRGIVRGRVIDI